MDVRKLEAFCKVYELQSFSKAGDELFLSQPTISSHVANLEGELGVKLFDRMGRVVMPTEAGHVLYHGSQSVFEHLEQARASIEMLRDKVVGELVVGCSTIPSHNIMPGLLNGFTARYPQVGFTIHTSGSDEVIRKVSEGVWPVGIVGTLPSEENLVAEMLREDEVAVVAASKAAWCPQDHDAISMEALAELPWIMRAKGSGTRHVMEKALADIGKTLQDLNVRCRVETTCETLAHTLAGVGVSVTSELACKEFLDNGVLTRLQVPQLAGVRKFYLIYHKERYMFPALSKFVEYALSNK